MTARGQLRPIRRNGLTRFCAGALIALVLCPFTAPFASYDPNASVVSFLSQDASLLDKACEKVVSAEALSAAIVELARFDPLTTVVNRRTPIDLLLQRSMVLRV